MARSYRRKTARQLLLEKKKARQQKLLSVIGLTIVSAVFLVVLFVWFSYLEFVNLKGIVVQGYSNPSLLRSFIMKNINSKNSFASTTFLPLINTTELEQKILKSFPDIQSIKINKNYKSQILKVEVNPKEPVFVFCNPQQECFWIDSGGVIYKKLSKSQKTEALSKNSIPLLLVWNPQEYSLFSKIFAKSSPDADEKFSFLKSLTDILNKRFKVEKIYIKDPTDLVAYVYLQDKSSKKKFFIKVDTRTDPKKVFENFTAVYNKLKNESINYIDLRFGHKVFYKLNQEDDQEQENKQD